MKPRCESNTSGFTFTWDDEAIAADVRNVDDNHGFSAEVRFYTLDGAHIDRQTINMLSVRGKTECANRLKKLAGNLDWPRAIEDLCEGTITQWRTGEPMDIAVPQRRTADAYALGPFVLKDKPTLFYGDGGALKTTLVQAMMLSLSTGQAVLPGTIPVGSCSVGIFDWEEEPDDFRDRLAKLMRGAGLKDPGKLYHRAMPHAISQSIPYMKSQVDRLGLKVVCIDSFGLAAGMTPEGSDAAIRVFSAVRALRPMTSVVVHHVAKIDRDSDSPVAPYGSVYIRNQVRLAWECKLLNEDEGGPPLVGLRAEKANYSARGQVSGFRVNFTPEAITFQGTSVTFEKATATKKIVAWLKTMGEATYEQMAGNLSINIESVGRICRRLSDRGEVAISEATGRGNKVVVKWVSG